MIQEAFGWENYHLFEFEDKEYESSIRISIPSEDDFDFGVKTQHASKVKLSKIFSSNSPKLLYVYDFGDSWVHEITLEAITDDNQKRAVCLSGKREWLDLEEDEVWDADSFNIDEVNTYLKQV